MKRILLFLTLFCSWHLSVIAQFTLEHVYNVGNGTVSRLKLDNGSLKYFYVDNEAYKVRLYNEDHSEWKTVDYSMLNPADGSAVQAVNPSVNYYDADDGLELQLYIHNPTTQKTKLVIIDETQGVLHSLEFDTTVHMTAFDFSTDRIMLEMGEEIMNWSNTGKLYNAKTLDEIESFTHGGFIHVKDGLDLQGVFCAVDNDNDVFYAYNQDGEVLFQTSLPAITDKYNLYGMSLSKHILNTDDDYELLIGSEMNVNSPPKAYYLNQNGEVLKEFEANSFQIESDWNGPKRIVTTKSGVMNVEMVAYNMELTEEYSISGIQLLRYPINGNGEMITVSSSFFGPTVEVYHEDGTLWEEMDLVMADGLMKGAALVSSYFFNDDEALECIYVMNNVIDIGESVIYLVGSDGETIQVFEGVVFFDTLSYPGEPNKLLVSHTMFNGNDFTEVYDLGTIGSLTTEEWERTEDLMMYPNPVETQLKIQLDDHITAGEIFIYSITGALVQQQELTSNLMEIPVQQLKAGVYLLQVRTGEQVLHQKFIKE